MALNGSVSVEATRGGNDDLVFSWEAVQDQNTMTSTISWKLELVAYAYGRIEQSAAQPWTVTIDGQEFSGTASVNIANNETKTLAAGEIVLTHNEDGTRSFAFTFSQELNITWGASSGNPIYVGAVTGEGNGELDPLEAPESEPQKFPIKKWLAGLIAACCSPRRAFPQREPIGYLTFASAAPFTIGVSNATKNWDGNLYYSTNTAVWNEWDGTTAIASSEHGGEQKIYVRGSGNTGITTGYLGRWVLVGNNIRCFGNIENLLDYETASLGVHPEMRDLCYSCLFDGCTNLVTAPELPAIVLVKHCYSAMFAGCTNLVTVPSLPATTLAPYCYADMFGKCTSLVALPELPATTLPTGCYSEMFQYCSSIKLSAEKTDEYSTAYRIPTSGTGVVNGTDPTYFMFGGTGGTFTGVTSQKNAEINTTYYLHKDNVVVSSELIPIYE